MLGSASDQTVDVTHQCKSQIAQQAQQAGLFGANHHMPSMPAHRPTKLLTTSQAAIRFMPITQRRLSTGCCCGVLLSGCTRQHSIPVTLPDVETSKAMIIQSSCSLQNGSCRSQFQQKAAGVLPIIILLCKGTRNALAGKGGNKQLPWKLQQSHLLKISPLKPR